MNMHERTSLVNMLLRLARDLLPVYTGFQPTLYLLMLQRFVLVGFLSRSGLYGARTASCSLSGPLRITRF